ncbi:DNA-directed RNA polymerase subunit beta' [bacterium]|nr:DNA-directed RNA polymerase subunit beta' [bacterium]
MPVQFAIKDKKDEAQKFTAIQVRLASPDTIRSWSYGEVTRPETINYRTFKPENDGLFCQKIFGPVRDFECACGKYKGSRYKGVVCDRCGVEVTHSRVRRERMGHIELAVPVTHIWYVRTTPSYIGTLLGLSYTQLDQIIYYESYIVTDPGDPAVTGLKYKQLLSEQEYRELKAKGLEFEAMMGAPAIKKLLQQIKLDEIAAELRSKINLEKTEQQRKILLKRLSVVEAFRLSGNRPEWMVLEVIPVLPPELRPLIPLEGGRFATSDLNDLYRRLINRNNRLKKLIEIQAPEVILRNEKRMLQEAVDALIENGKVTTAVRGQNKRPLKSLSDFLRGKQGRFRQNLLGKRVDYSGRAVIVVNPNLKIWQCGLPKTMALELFKPFLIRKLEEKGITQNPKTAKKYVERARPEVWDLLEEVTKDHPVLLNRAPTLHRLSIQAFYPVLVEGKAIQIHPLVCAAFNADFDGDQMAVHVPLGFEAQLESHILMISSNNILLPANGSPIASPSQDMVLGIYYMTKMKPGDKGEGKVFSSPEEAIIAYDQGLVGVHAKIFVRMPAQKFHFVVEDGMKVNEGDLIARIPKYPRRIKKRGREKKFEIDYVDIKAPAAGTVKLNISVDIKRNSVVTITSEDGTEHAIRVPHAYVETTVGRVLFNSILPPELGFRNQLMKKSTLKQLISEAYDIVGIKRTAEFLDRIKEFGFEAATNGSISIGMDDLIVPPEKEKLIAKARKEIKKILELRQKGVITEKERYNNVISVWMSTQEQITKALFDVLSKHKGGFNPLAMMVDSGARGSQDQIRQLSALRGLMSKPQKRMVAQTIIETPILSSFRDGLTMIEYFISSHGQRKGLADTALKTADAGYLTRRLVDVAQDVYITEEDCGTIRGIERRALKDGEKVIIPLRDRIMGRYAAEDVYDPVTGEILVEMNQYITPELARLIEDRGIESVRIRSVLTCESRRGVCAKCFGMDMATRQPVSIGEAVGIIAGESIGEPGTQLTLRTFHIGGIAAAETEQTALVTRYAGKVEYSHLKVVPDPEGRGKGIVMNRTGALILTDKQGLKHKYEVPYGARLMVEHQQEVEKGDTLYEWDPYINPILSDVEGEVELVDIVEDVTVKEMVDEATMTRELVVIQFREKKLNPRVLIKKDGKVIATYYLPTDAHILVKNGQHVKPGQPLAKLLRAIMKTRDITGGLPRVTELFEARKPKNPAIIAEITGTVKFLGESTKKPGFNLIIYGDQGEVMEYFIPRGKHILVQDGDHVEAGQKLADGSIIPHDILRIKGEEAVMNYLLDEIQKVYAFQGVSINDKHIEIIIRQMLRKVLIIDGGDTKFLEGEQVDRYRVIEENARVQAQGGRPATFQPLLLSITRASLTTESFISAASFQETVRVLTQAVVAGKIDYLRGLKENIIIGRLIPAGTGFRKYAKIRPDTKPLDESEERDFMEKHFVIVTPEEIEERHQLPIEQ